VIDRMKRLLLLAACTVLLPAAASAATGPTLCGGGLLQKIPARHLDALDGSDFARRVWAIGADEREQAIEDELLAGNIPRFLRRLFPVELEGQVDHRTVRVTVCVLPDYLAIGSDGDFLYAPMRLATALIVARQYGFMLPTAKIVDAIYAQAVVHLIPQPLPASDEMRSTAYYQRHTLLIHQQRDLLGDVPGPLTAGHKKDLIIANRLWRMPDRVAIYGWHRSDHDPIQPISTLHGARYADYSHGVRLVSGIAYVDGVARPLAEVLSDTKLGEILGNAGPIVRPAELMAMLSRTPAAHDSSERPPPREQHGPAVRVTATCSSEIPDGSSHGCADP
jgi:hypothetical protein